MENQSLLPRVFCLSKIYMVKFAIAKVEIPRCGPVFIDICITACLLVTIIKIFIYACSGPCIAYREKQKNYDETCIRKSLHKITLHVPVEDGSGFLTA